MLNHHKLFHELSHSTASFFNQRSQQYILANKLWQQFVHMSAARLSSVLGWSYIPEKIYPLHSLNHPYTIGAVDGSQIYPDRHQGVAYYVLNIGNTVIHYEIEKSSVELNSEPFLLLKNEIDFKGYSDREIVDAQRAFYERKYGIQLAGAFTDKSRSLLLIDGSLYMPIGDIEKKADEFMQQLAFMEQIYRQGVLFAGYISLPKHRDLVMMIQAERVDQLSHIFDSDIMHHFLIVGSRTVFFYYKKPEKLPLWYPSHLVPYYAYINNGYEIVRIELPAFIAMNEEKCEAIFSMIMDQSIKGEGYPVVLALAHEQAVVKEADRAAFYEMLQILTRSKQEHYPLSQKSIHKRRIAI